MIESLPIDNVRFSQAIYLRGSMDTNVKVGRYNCTITEEKGGVVIDIPADKQNNAQRFVTRIPYSKILQIEFKVS